MTKSASIAGSAIGSMFFIGFGTAWITAWAVDSFKSPWALVAGIFALAALLFFESYRQYKVNQKALNEDSKSAARKKISRTFNIINAAQWILIIGAAVILPKIWIRKLGSSCSNLYHWSASPSARGSFQGATSLRDRRYSHCLVIDLPVLL